MTATWLDIGVTAVLLVLAIALLYRGRSFWAWVLPSALALGWWGIYGVSSIQLFGAASGVLLLLAAVFGLPAVRRQLVTRAIMPVLSTMLPRMSETERIALEAGTVWWDGDLFSGKPDWKKLLEFKRPGLSGKEDAFLEGPVEQLCRMLDDWQVIQRRDLPPEIWDFLKKNRFFGMIIPEDYGGLGFSALAHSQVIVKIASRSVTAAVSVMVPNSLGPAELLLHYGTEQQKRDYLPRLARGEDIPCFALTGPEAGSDAAATQSIGIVCRGTFEGREVLGMRLNWTKRYITLGPVATVIGLAFKLRDSDRLLSQKEDLGITCALIPTQLPGIDIGRRHDPMGIPFMNGPNSGRDVFVPLDFIIGGPGMAGKGWRMLMESLAAGRSISLPSLSVGGAELATRLIGAYATVREQFDNPIGRFEGIEEPLARIGGLTYLMNSARKLTLGALDSGHKPAVISAIVKAYLTEALRMVVNDAMDIRAGAAICQGPRNALSRMYVAAPIGITVEGANILTRSMIIYGQGAIRCHPFVQEEMRAVAERDVARLDRAFFGHVNHISRNAARAFLLGLTNGWIAGGPLGGEVKRYFGKFTRVSAAFAIVSDVAMGTLGGRLKRKEKISGRLADVLAWMYLGSAALKEFVDADQPERDLPLVRRACEHALHQCHRGLGGLLQNLPNRSAASLLRWMVFPWGVRQQLPSDKLGTAVARGLLEDREARLHLTTDIFVPPPDEPGLGRMEAALDKAVDAIIVETKVRDALRAGLLDKAPGDALLLAACQDGVLTRDECTRVEEAREIRNEVIQVDSFDPAEFLRLR